MFSFLQYYAGKKDGRIQTKQTELVRRPTQQQRQPLRQNSVQQSYGRNYKPSRFNQLESGRTTERQEYLVYHPATQIVSANSKIGVNQRRIQQTEIYDDDKHTRLKLAQVNRISQNVITAPIRQTETETQGVREKQFNPTQFNTSQEKSQNDGLISQAETKSISGHTNEGKDVAGSVENYTELYKSSIHSTPVMGMQKLGLSHLVPQKAPTIIRHYPHQAIPRILSPIGHQVEGIKSAEIES